MKSDIDVKFTYNVSAVLHKIKGGRKMKRIMSLLLTLSMVLSIGIISVQAEETYLINQSFEVTAEQVTGKTQARDIAVPAHTGNEVIEIDYDFRESSTTELTNFNIPFALKSNGVEFARITMHGDTVAAANTAEYLMTKFRYINSSGVETMQNLSERCVVLPRQGKIKMYVDYENERVIVTSKTNGFRTEAFMGYAPFGYKAADQKVDVSNGVTVVSIGASGTPQMIGNVKVFVPSDASIYKLVKTVYGYETDSFTSGINNNYHDFKNCNAAVKITKDETTDNHYLNIPKGIVYSGMFTPQHQGFEGRFDVSYKQYIAGDRTGYKLTLGDYGGKTIATIEYLTDTRIKITGKNSGAYVDYDQSVLNKWVDVKVKVDLNEGKASIQAGNTTSAVVSIDANPYMNYMTATCSGSDLYIDDLTIANVTDSVYQNEYTTSFTLNKAATVDTSIPLDPSRDVVLEIDYDFEKYNSDNTEVTSLNLPFILRSNNAEVARFSIMDTYSQTAERYKTKITADASGAKTDSGIVAKKGKIQIIVDYTAKIATVKYSNPEDTFKPEALLASVPFTDGVDVSKGIDCLKIGASGAPKTDISIKAITPDSLDDYKMSKTSYTYETDSFASGINKDYQDFRNSTETIKISEEASGNHYVDVPKEGIFNVRLTPQLQGFEGRFNISYRQYLNGETDMTTNDNYFRFGHYGNLGTFIEVKCENSNKIRIQGIDSLNRASVAFDTSALNRWVDIRIEVDLINHKAVLAVDGRRSAPVAINNEATYIEYITMQSKENDMWIDNLTIENVSQTVYVDPSSSIELVGDEYVATFSAGNKALAKSDMLVAVATYNGQKMQSVKLDTMSWTDTVDKTLRVSAADVTSVKAFIWDLSTMEAIVGYTTPAAQ